MNRFASSRRVYSVTSVHKENILRLQISVDEMHCMQESNGMQHLFCYALDDVEPEGSMGICFDEVIKRVFKPLKHEARMCFMMKKVEHSNVERLSVTICFIDFPENVCLNLGRCCIAFDSSHNLECHSCVILGIFAGIYFAKSADSALIYNLIWAKEVASAAIEMPFFISVTRFITSILSFTFLFSLPSAATSASASALFTANVTAALVPTSI